MQITFTVNDDRRALELVASFLNDTTGTITDVTVLLDELESYTARAQAFDQLHATDAFNQEFARRIKANAKLRATVASTEPARDLEMRYKAIDLNDGQNRLRAEANWQRHLEAQQAMSVACPTCGVDIDEVCRSQKTHKAHSGYAHIDRIRAQAATRYGDAS